MADDAPRVSIESVGELREWLAANHARAGSIWLVRWKRDSGRAHVAWGDVVDECLCFGWIDSLPRRLDERRSMLRLSPRGAGSAWSGVNRRRVARLEREGRMRAPGRRAVERARADGSWTFLDDVDRLEIPDDLGAALDALPDARRRFERFPDSSKRGILEWIKTAKRPETRRRRIEDTASRAALNRKANFPAGRDAGPRE